MFLDILNGRHMEPLYEASSGAVGVKNHSKLTLTAKGYTAVVSYSEV